MTFIRRKFDGKTEIAFFLTAASTILCLVSFVTPYWLVSWPRIHTPLNSLGLWEFCLNGYTVRSDPSMRTYFGCWWIFAPEYGPIRHILSPRWFQAVQALVTLEFVANVVCLVLFLLYVLRSCNTRYPKRAKLWLKIIIALLIFSTLCSWTATMLFGLCYADEYWMPFHQLNYPHYSFFVHIIAGGVVFSTVLFLVRRVDIESEQAVTYEHEFKMVPSAASSKPSALRAANMKASASAERLDSPKKYPEMQADEDTARPLVSGNF